MTWWWHAEEWHQAPPQVELAFKLKNRSMCKISFKIVYTKFPHLTIHLMYFSSLKSLDLDVEAAADQIKKIQDKVHFRK